MKGQRRDKGHKRQHYVPSSYLAAWIDPTCPEGHEPYVWVFPRDGGGPRNRPPFKVCTERDIYTIPMPGGGRDLRLEEGLHGLEDSFARIRRDFIEPRKALPAVPRAKLLAFLVTMHARTPIHRQHIQDQWQPVLDLGEEMLTSLRKMTPEQRRRAADLPVLPSKGPRMTLRDVRRIMEQPLQTALPSHLRVVTPRLAAMNLTVLCATGDARFITSDNPCVWCDPEAYKRPPMYRATGLKYRSLEITLPISPGKCLLVTHHHELHSYIDVPEDVVDEMNRRTLGFAGTEFIAQTAVAKPIWYDPGIPPADQWAQPDHSDPD